MHTKDVSDYEQHSILSTRIHNLACKWNLYKTIFHAGHLQYINHAEAETSIGNQITDLGETSVLASSEIYARCIFMPEEFHGRRRLKMANEVNFSKK